MTVPLGRAAGHGGLVVGRRGPLLPGITRGRRRRVHFPPPPQRPPVLPGDPVPVTGRRGTPRTGCCGLPWGVVTAGASRLTAGAPCTCRPLRSRGAERRLLGCLPPVGHHADRSSTSSARPPLPPTARGLAPAGPGCGRRSRWCEDSDLRPRHAPLRVPLPADWPRCGGGSDTARLRRDVRPAGRREAPWACSHGVGRLR